jgi:hypothetical protein
LPSATATATHTPLPVNVVRGDIPAIQIYQSPGGPAIGVLWTNQPLVELHQQQVYNNLVWVQVMDADGRVGWIPAIYLATFTPSPTATASRVPSLTPTP